MHARQLSVLRAEHSRCLLRLLVGFLFSASLAVSAQTPCKVTRENFVNHGSAAVAMTLDQGATCALAFRFGGTAPPDSWKLVKAPKSGDVVFKDDMAEYRPGSDFSGEDKFTVEVFIGRAPNCGNHCERNGQFEVTATVTPRK